MTPWSKLQRNATKTSAISTNLSSESLFPRIVSAFAEPSISKWLASPVGMFEGGWLGEK